MKPVSRKDRVAYNGGPRVSVADVNSKGHDNIDELRFLSDLDSLDNYNEDGEMSFIADNNPKKMTDEDIKVKALNLAIGIAKLMSDVSTDDILSIAAKVALYIKF